MSLIPKTVGELRTYLETFPDDLEIYAQNDTTSDPNATPSHFVAEYWRPDAEPAMLLLAVLSPFESRIAERLEKGLPL